MTGSVIFIHPDGASAATWAATRALYVGPDNNLNWDLLPAVAVYRGHMNDSLTATSNGGATTHAFGIKVASSAFGLTEGGENGERIVDADGHSRSVAMQAMRAGMPVGLVQSGVAVEPGTACFVTEVERRSDYFEIAAQLIESDAKVLFSGGEKHFLPAGVQGVHGEGTRPDGRNLVAEAIDRGYTVVRTRDEMLSLPTSTTKVLGLFAHDATFNDRPEEILKERGLPNFDPDAPTIAEMTEVAIRLLSAGGERFLLVVEEEATDNMGNNNNASGTLEAAKRADEAIGVALRYLADNPQTLLLTCADGDGGGLRMRGIVQKPGSDVPRTLPPWDSNGGPIDGVSGSGSAPFIAAPDRNGRSLPFMVVWASKHDVSGGVLVRADGLNSQRVRGTVDNTQIAELIRLTLFGSPDGPMEPALSAR
jgi:alkaline phosphatase